MAKPTKKQNPNEMLEKQILVLKMQNDILINKIKDRDEAIGLMQQSNHRHASTDAAKERKVHAFIGQLDAFIHASNEFKGAVLGTTDAEIEYDRTSFTIVNKLNHVMAHIRNHTDEQTPMSGDRDGTNQLNSLLSKLSNQPPMITKAN